MRKDDCESYYLEDIIGKLEAIHKDLNAVRPEELLSTIQEAIVRMRAISVAEDTHPAFVFQIDKAGAQGDVAIGTGRNLVAALLAIGVSSEEAEAACDDVIWTLHDELVPVHRGSNFKVVARRTL